MKCQFLGRWIWKIGEVERSSCWKWILIFIFIFIFFERKEILLELERSGVTILSLVNSCDCVLGISFFIVFVFYSFSGFLSTLYICVWE